MFYSKIEEKSNKEKYLTSATTPSAPILLNFKLSEVTSVYGTFLLSTDDPSELNMDFRGIHLSEFNANYLKRIKNRICNFNNIKLEDS